MSDPEHLGAWERFYREHGAAYEEFLKIERDLMSVSIPKWRIEGLRECLAYLQSDDSNSLVGLELERDSSDDQFVKAAIDSVRGSELYWRKKQWILQVSERTGLPVLLVQFFCWLQDKRETRKKAVREAKAQAEREAAEGVDR